MRLALLMALVSMAGCSWFHRGSPKCREPSLPVGLANGASLKIPAGLDAPDARGAVRIPELKEPETPRGKKDPCLSVPPAYKGGPS
ncbi:MAG: hypothetical protein IT480_07570 [Gammaproteobacteria bacterium]|nr:hypothetical protein [Gammaproteobacteria bacterium]